ncbi:YihY/virulence factor BrkB family protein [Agromyces bracchium]|uniref:YihY/virulence factor BrkB family protein n=1 Tax=Agromyces bracchium TaxID=88376 RepID=A0A6I3M7K0_9MICO|nr:YihY/virulence factor BrkB family protein [Agromyces bracchium]MTH68951.1 YihY/virulence factor BrkB family protein [Agromyces bracchium]
MSDRDRGRGRAVARADGAPANGAPGNGAPANGTPSSAAPARASDGPVLATPGEPVPTTTARVRERFEAASAPLRERLDEPITRMERLTQRTMALFPVRVWRHFLARNGFLLTAGMSYQSLFAVFAAVYIVFAVAGIWLLGDTETLNALLLLINTYAPGLVGPDGVISTEDLQAAATASTSLFGWTGAVALGGLIWTAIGWVTYARMAVRSIFLLPKDDRAYLYLKARDFAAAFMFGVAILVAAVLSIVATGFLDWMFGLLGIDLTTESPVVRVGLQFGAIIVVFIIDTLALAVMFRFLSGAEMPWRRMWTGSLLGSAALSVLQMLGGWVLSWAGSNPLLATFTVIVALLLWFRIASIIILVAAAWIAVEAADRNESLRRVTAAQLEAERRQREYEALRTAATIRVREARVAAAAARWYERVPASRRLAKTRRDLDELEASAPPPPPTKPHPWLSGNGRGGGSA